MKKISIEDIIKKSERISGVKGMSSTQIYTIKSLLDSKGNNYDEILKYCIISMVTCIEVSFRNYICELIDYGSPYFKNISNFKDKPFNFDFIAALNDNKITVGQFISNALPISSFENIISHMDNILGEKFLKMLETIEHDKMAIKTGVIVENPSKVYSNIKEIFFIRHICVHEIVSSELLAKIKLNIREWYESFYIFIDATEHLINYRIYPTAYMTQSEMNQLSNNCYFEASAEIKTKVKSIKNILNCKLNNDYERDFKREIKERLNDFISNQELWEKYSETSAKYIADFYKGGSIWSMIYGEHLSKIAQGRKQELNIIEDYLSEL